MAVSTATVMRTITSVTTIATTVTAPVTTITTSFIPPPVTITQSVIQVPVTRQPQNDPSSSATTSSLISSLLIQSSSTLTPTISSPASAATSAASDPASDAPVFDKQPTTTSSVPTKVPTSSIKQPASTSTVLAPTSPIFNESPISSATSPVKTKASHPIEQPLQTQEDGKNSQPSSIPVSQDTSLHTTLLPSGQTTQDSSPVTTGKPFSQSIEKAVFQPAPTSTAGVASVNTSPNLDSPLTSSALTTTLPFSSISIPTSATDLTKPSEPLTTEKGNLEITTQRSSFITSTLTTIALDPAAASDTSSPSETAVGAVGSSPSDKPSTPVIVGSVVGSLAALSAIIFLYFVLRRRMAKSRHSTLLTPLSVPRGTSGNGARSEKRKQYEIDAASLGPTPRSAKLAAALAFYPKQFGKKLRPNQTATTDDQSAVVNMNRGNSQFMEPARSHSRHESVNRTTGNRMQGWWSRVFQESDDLMALDMAERANHPVPTYLPKMNAEPGVARESQARRMSRPHSIDSWTSRASSQDPFSDANAASGGAAKSKYQLVNPFADSASVTLPSAAQLAAVSVGDVQGVQRSGSQALGYNPRHQPRRESFDSASLYRNSADMNDSFETRRNKVHSNPFDLEINNQQPPMAPGMRPPRREVTSSVYDEPRPDSEGYGGLVEGPRVGQAI